MNQLIIWDCIGKIFVFALVLLVYATEFSILGGGKVGLVLCALRAFLGTALFGFNRLVPVGIVVFRYIMVCHAVMTANCGGEKRVWRIIQRAIFLLSFLPSVLVVRVLEDSLGFHKCVGQEESFRLLTLKLSELFSSLLRYNLKNFFLDVGPTGLNIKGPLWRPVRLVTNIIALTFSVFVPVLYGIIFRSPEIIRSSSLFVAPSQRM